MVEIACRRKTDTVVGQNYSNKFGRFSIEKINDRRDLNFVKECYINNTNSERIAEKFSLQL